MPIAKTAMQIKKLKVGDILEIVADDKGIKSDIPAWCKTTGHEFLGMEEKGTEIHLFVRKKHE
jgi:TusA-related sulfurtransferase